MTRIASRFLREGRSLPQELEEARLEIKQICENYGLDFFETVFEMCTYEEINMIASYGGFPTRYPHWRFGMEYLQMQKSYEYGLSKIYEMVINTDPSYAYLLDNNLVVDQKLVMAHVYGHVDFFKNNQWFKATDRRMLDTMANHATRIREIIDRQGASEVEAFIDLCLSLDNLIDPFMLHIARTRAPEPPPSAEVGRFKTERSYMEPHINPPDYLRAVRTQREAASEAPVRFPEEPVRDVLGFLLQTAPLAPWKRQILEIIRTEAMYFAPQGQTKIMNEGWATYWHTTVMTKHILTDAEVIDYADHHSGTVAQQPGQLNPYRLGLELFRNIEKRWDRGQFGKAWLDCDDPNERKRWDLGTMKGREKIFEVRQTHNDVTFIDTFLTPDFCREQGFFTTQYNERTGEWVVDSHEFADIKRQLLQMLASRGTPRVSVQDANAYNRGELLLSHEHEGLDIQLDWAVVTLENLVALWGRPVHLDTLLEGKPIRLTHDGVESTRTENP